MSQSAAKLIRLIQQHKLRLFTTADIRTLTGMNPAAATHALCRFEAQDLLSRIKRGLWVNRLVENFNPYEALGHLTSPWPSYVSLYSTLADRDIIEEVPQVIYAVSSGPPKRYETAIGRFHIHHLPSHLLWGYEMRRSGRGSYPMAEAEKAFLDLVYLGSIPRSPIQLPYKRDKTWNLDRRKLRRYAARFQFQPLMDYLKHQGL